MMYMPFSIYHMGHKPAVFMMVALSILLCVAGCSTGTVTQGQPLPELTFEHLPSVNLSVANVRVKTSYDSTLRDEDVSDQMPIPPDVAIRQYLNQRLEAVGNQGDLVIDIEDATVTKGLVEPEGTVSKWLGINKREEFKVNVEMRVQHIRNDGSLGNYTTLYASRVLELPESLSLAERDAKQLEMIEQLINEIDPVLTDALVQTLKILPPDRAEILPLPEMWGQQNKDREQL